jgi:hypothetical protein
MATDIATAAAGLTAQLRMTGRRTVFERAVEELRRLLETVPDHAAGELSPETLASLSSSAERAIDRIEERISDGADPASSQLALARAVYAIRSSLEAMERWRHHYTR